MNATTPDANGSLNAEAHPDPAARSLLTHAVLAIVAAIAGNVVVWWLATTLFDIPDAFPPLAGPGPAVIFTLVGMIGAVIAWRIILGFSSTPDRTFRRTAVVVLLLSFVPDLLLLTEGAAEAVPGVTISGVLTLMVMHVVAAAAAVYFLTGGSRAG